MTTEITLAGRPATVTPEPGFVRLRSDGYRSTYRRLSVVFTDTDERHTVLASPDEDEGMAQLRTWAKRR